MGNLDISLTRISCVVAADVDVTGFGAADGVFVSRLNKRINFKLIICKHDIEVKDSIAK